MRTFRLAGIQLALAAMVLRALLPAGWMPDTTVAGGTVIAICTADGPVRMAMGDVRSPDKQPPANGDAHHVDACPFAAAPHAATFAPVDAHILPVGAFFVAPPASQPRLVAGAHHYAPQSPRAPPSFV